MGAGVVIISVLGGRSSQRSSRLDGLDWRRREGVVCLLMRRKMRMGRRRIEVLRWARVDGNKPLLEDGGGVHLQLLEACWSRFTSRDSARHSPRAGLDLGRFPRRRDATVSDLLRGASAEIRSWMRSTRCASWWGFLCTQGAQGDW